MPTIKFNPISSIIVSKVTFYGSIAANTRMIFDTGASYTMIPWKVAKALHLTIDYKKTLETTTASAIESPPLVIIPKVSVLGEEVKNVAALVKDLPIESDIDGLLGLNFLKHFNINIDFQKGKLTLKKYL